MNKFRKNMEYLFLQIKSAFLSIPKILLSTVVLAALVVLIVFAVSVAMESNDEDYGKMVVAVVYSEEETSPYSEMAISFISEIETVKNNCIFEETDEKTAYKGLEDDTYAAAIIIPPNVIEDIIRGINTPIKVVFPAGGVNNSSVLFRELCNAGTADLSSAEAGVYAMDDVFFTILKDKKNKQRRAEDELSVKYFSYALNRSVYFEMQDISERDGLNSIQYYTCTGIVLLLLLSGITCTGLFNAGSRLLKKVLAREGVGNISMAVSTILGVSLVYFILLTCTYCVVLILGNAGSNSILSGIIRAGDFGSIAGAVLEIGILVFSVFSFIYFLNNLIENEVYSTLALFLLGIAGMYASGCFVMQSMLPPLVRKLGMVIPMNGYFQLAGQILTGNLNIGICAGALGYAALFILLSAAVNKIRR
ncbi:MAG: ABC transporter permease [Lachnospira sp.]